MAQVGCTLFSRYSTRVLVFVGFWILLVMVLYFKPGMTPYVIKNSIFTWSQPPGDQTRNNTVAIVSTVSTATTLEVETSTTQPHTTKSHLNTKPNSNIKPNLNIKKNRKSGKYNYNSLKYERQTKSTSVSSENRYTNYCSVYDLSQPIEASYQCVNSRIAGMSPAKICLYDVRVDIYVSGSIAESGSWEGNMVAEVNALLNRYPGSGLLDIGANIGMYTLPIAKAGKKVVAVEPNLESIHRIQKSAQLSRTTHNIILVTNGLSDERTKAALQLDERNQGNTRVVDGKPCTSNCGHNISTVLLDDLLEVIPFKTAIMKIDIQAHEHKAFAHAEKLLDTVSIPYIFMEFQEMKTLYISSNHISKDKRMIANMIAMLQRRGYKPRSGIRSRVLNPNTWQYWPNDMVWVRD